MPKHSTLRIGNIGAREAFGGKPVSPAFGQSIAKALAPMKIGVATLAPGFVETDVDAR